MGVKEDKPIVHTEFCQTRSCLDTKLYKTYYILTKSRSYYDKEYDKFVKWMTENCVKDFNKTGLLGYFPALISTHLGKIPFVVAMVLGLSNPDHCLQWTSATILPEAGASWMELINSSKHSRDSIYDPI